jgi:hypothetical protein
LGVIPLLANWKSLVDRLVGDQAIVLAKKDWDSAENFLGLSIAQLVEQRLL